MGVVFLTNNCGLPKAVSFTAVIPVPYVAPVKKKGQERKYPVNESSTTKVYRENGKKN